MSAPATCYYRGNHLSIETWLDCRREDHRPPIEQSESQLTEIEQLLARVRELEAGLRGVLNCTTANNRICTDCKDRARAALAGES